MKLSRGRAGSTRATMVGAFAAALISASLVTIGATPASADAAAGTITTIAGTGTVGYGGDGGAATSATLDAPNDVVVGYGGNIFVADWSAHVVRMIASQDCVVGSTCPFGLSTTKGDIYTVVGQAGMATSTGDGGPASAATLEQPAHLAFDNNGNLLIADLQANVVRLVAAATCSSSCPFGLTTTTAGDIYAIAGNATASTTGDGGPATSAKLNSPRGLAVTSNGVLYIADYGSNKIRKVAADGTITTLAGTGAVGPASATPVAATAATFDGPISLALNAGVAATLYVSDASNHAIRTVDLSTSMVNTIAGTGQGGYSGDGGPAASAKLFYPDGLGTDSVGNLFIADYENNVVREIPVAPTNGMTAGNIYTVAGNGTAGRSGDTGTATAGQLHGPSGVAVDSAGNLIIADTNNHVVRQVSDIEKDTAFASTDPVPTAPTYRQAVLADSPTLYYRLDEPVGSTHAENSAGAGDGTSAGTYGAAVTLGTAGAIGNDTDGAASSAGAGTMVTGPAASALPNGAAPRTVELWEKTTTGMGCVSGPCTLFEYGGEGFGGSRFGLGIGSSGTNLHFEGYGSGYNQDWATPNLADGSWHHIAIVYDGVTTITPYVDGQSLGARTLTGPLATGTDVGDPLTIGGAFDDISSNNFAGSMDEFAIYPTALAADQINQHIAVSGRPPNPPATVSVASGANQATVSWAPSTTNPGTPAVSSYSIQALDANGDTAGVTTIPVSACTGGACSATVTGLSAATAGTAAPYTVEVAGVSPAGVGLATVSSTFTPTGLADSYRTAVLADTPALYYRLDSSYRNGVDDFSGHGLGAYAPIAVDTLGAAGGIANDSDGALSSSGSGTMVTGPAASALPNGAAPRTVELWEKTTTGMGCVSGPCTLFEYGGEGFGGSRFGLGIGSSGTNLHFEGYGSGYNQDWATPNLADGSWHHIAIVYDGVTTITPYVDGQSLGARTLTGPLATGTDVGDPLTIGGAFDDISSNNFAGSMDEFAIYPTALAADQIAAHFAAASAVPVATMPTTTSVDSGTNPSLADQSVTFTATVTPVGATGAVAFSDDSDGAALACSGTVDPTTGQATCTVSNLSVGTHVITAAYSGDSAYAASSGSMSMPQVVQAPSKIHLTPSTTHPSYGEDVTVTATVASAREGMTATPTGHVQFFLDGSSDPTTCSGLTQVALDSGQASCMFTGLTAGAYTVDAKYVGDDANGTYAASKAAQLPVAVAKASSTTGLGVDHATSMLGDAVTFTATVTSAASPSGTVLFLDDSTALSCTGADDSSVSNGTATCTVAGLSMGAHQVTATYSGDDNHRSSTSSPAQSVTVNQAATTTDVGASPTTSMAGDAVTFTATVSTSYGTPSGTVTFREGTTDLGARSLAAGKATFITTALAVGAHHITASYGGDADHATSASSPPLTVTVNAASTGGGGGGSSGGSGGAAPPASPAPPAPPAGSTSSESGTSQSSTGTADATDGDTTVDASGAGAFTVAHYGDNPTPYPLPGASEFIDTKTADGSSFTRLSITICVTYPAPVLKWFDPTANNGAGAWVPVTGSTETSASTVCVTVTLSATSSPSLSQLTGTVFAVAPGPDFTATGPTRVLDTRSGTGVAKGQVGPKGTITLTVPNLPAGTTAVVLNLTATGLSGAQTSYVSACPAAQALASCTKTSAINALQGVDAANEITVPVASDGKITLYNNAGSIDLVGDLVGYETGGYSATGPTRVLDTRTGTGVAKAQVGPQHTITLTVPSLPAGTSAAVLNLTATGLTGAATTFISACPAAQTLSTCTATSALNAVAGRDIANEITVPVGPDGKIILYNNAGNIDVAADLVGFETGGYTATGPTRVLDTRAGTGAAKAPVGAKGTITLTVPKLPASTTAAVLNLTGTGLTGAATSYISACPAAQTLSACTATSVLNVIAGRDIANEITVPVGPDGKITLYNNAGSIDLAADLVGFHVGA